ncbi:MAG: ABC transporter permease [Bacteroidales bacterium]|nr:ABC transporter permease [Bacteroidales bacterium]
MTFESFISKRLIKAKESSSANRVIRIAVVSVALSVAVMLISMSVLTGFKNGVKEKITGFGSHIRILPFTASASYSDVPVYIDNRSLDLLSRTDNVKSITPVLNKSAVIISGNDFHAVILKGITGSYDTAFFHDALVSGNMPKLGKDSKQEILVSKNISDKLNLETGDKIKVYFYINDNYRSKNFYISGIYDTGLGDYDERFLICDAEVLQNLFSLEENDFSSYEVTVENFSFLEPTADEIYEKLPQDMTVQTIDESEPSLFSWLNLLDSNVIMIIIIMILVTVVTLSSVILIMIYEKKQMIGILKSFGTPNSSIVKIFLYKVGYITLKGLLFGNIIALVIECVQKYTNLIKLDAQSYYLTSVPVEINPLHIILINAGAFIICMLCMLIPSRSIGKINVVENLKFE